MAKKRNNNSPSGMTDRVSPFTQISDDYSDDFQDDDREDTVPYTTVESYADESDADDEYDDEEDYFEDDDHSDLDQIKARLSGMLPGRGRRAARGADDGDGGTARGERLGALMDSIRGFLGTLQGKIIAGAIAFLLVVLLALTGVKLALMVSGGGDDAQDQTGDAQTAQDQTGETAGAGVVMGGTGSTGGDGGSTTAGIVFMPGGTQTDAPVATDTPEPEPTETPLPIILTNTPTPSPSPTPEPTPTPTVEPTPSPTPSPTPRVELAVGVTNRDANLRERAASGGKVKKVIAEGKEVVIHDVLTDSNGKVWYEVTATDDAVTGYMRDYVVDVDEERLSASLARLEKERAEQAELVPVGEDATGETATGNATTNRAANLRQSVGGSVITQLPKGQRVEVVSKEKDSSGNLWYIVNAADGTSGAMRDYVLTLDKGVEIPDTLTEEAKALLDREVIGEATTNRLANIRQKPINNAKVVRQLAKGVKLRVLAKYAGSDGKIWYEVVTENGATYGFVRDYVVEVTGVDDSVKAQTYTE